MSTLRVPALLLMTAIRGVAGGLQPPSPAVSVLLPDAVRGESYEVRLQLPLDSRCVSDGWWRIAGGDVPQGISADLSGLHGTLRQLGEYRFVLEAANKCGAVAIPVQLTVRTRPLLVVSSESIRLEVLAGSGPLTRHILVSSDWAELPFSITAGDTPWLSTTGAATTPAAGSALSAIAVDIHIRPRELAPGEYHAKLRISAWSAGNSPAVDVTLVVKAVAP